MIEYISADFKMLLPLVIWPISCSIWARSEFQTGAGCKGV